jgi:hypothetical protein
MTDRHDDNQAGPDELGKNSGQAGAGSAGQTGAQQQLSNVEDASEESVEELSNTDQALESAAVEGSEDAADHPERPTHPHTDYRRPEDVAPQREPGQEDEAA